MNIQKTNELIAQHRWFFGFLFLLGIIRLSFITKGQLFDWDEFRYFHAWGAIEHFMLGQWNTFITDFFSVQSRPGFILISLVPSAIQFLLFGFKIVKLTNPVLFVIPCIFNVAVTLGCTFIFYRLLLIVTRERFTALSGVVIYSLLTNTNLYVRQLMPYDYALFLYLLALFLVVKASESGGMTRAVSFNTGLITIAAHLIYPAYFVFIPALLIAVVVCPIKQPNQKRFPIAQAFVFAIAGGAALVDCISHLGYQEHYFAYSLKATNLINHGDFKEAFVFIVHYLSYVEGFLGVVLLTLFLAAACLRFPKVSISLKAFLWAMTIGYLMYAASSFFLKKFVFYGRIMHMYIPFLVLSSVLLINLIRLEKWKKGVLIGLVVLSVGSFIHFAVQFDKITYPRDLILKYLKDVPSNDILEVYSDDSPQQESAYEGYRYVVVNFEPYLGVKLKPKPFNIPSDFRLIVSKDYPLNFVPYQFEGYMPEARKAMNERKYKIQIYYRDKVSEGSRTKPRVPFHAWHFLGYEDYLLWEWYAKYVR